MESGSGLKSSQSFENFLVLSFFHCFMMRSQYSYLPYSILQDAYSLVTAVPFPLMSRLEGEEVCCSLVLYFLWEPQEDSVVDVSYSGSVCRPWRDHGGNGQKMCWKVAVGLTPQPGFL